MSDIKADSADIHSRINRAREYLESGDEFRARDIIVKSRNIPCADPSVHAEWAGLCEGLGMARQARECYERALKINPRNSEVLFLLARLLHDTGDYENAIHYLKKTLKENSAHSAARELLADNFQALGLEGRAAVLSPKRFKRAPSPIRYFPPSVGRADTEKYLHLFSGREIGYGLQSVSEKTGDVFYGFQGTPLTAELMAKHILGGLTIGGYPLRSDNTVKYIALMARVRKRAIESNPGRPGYLEYLNEKARTEIISLRALAVRRGIPACAEFDGGFGHRLWFFFREFIHFLKAKDFLDRLLRNHSVIFDHLVLERILGTRGTGIGWVEHPILLPLGVNRATNKRSLFLDDQGEPFEEQLKFLKRIREIPFKEALNGLKIPASFLSSADKKHPPSSSAEKLIDKCPVLAEITKKAGSGRVLPHGEKLILFYTIGLLDQNGTFLHRLLETCPDYNYKKVENQRTRLKPNPVSCLKIRELVPEITIFVSCTCSFDLRGGKYPSPLLHVNPHLVSAGKEFDIQGKIRPMDAAHRYLSLKRQASEINRALEKTASILDRHFSQGGMQKIRVGNIMLVRKPDVMDGSWEIEAIS